MAKKQEQLQSDDELLYLASYSKDRRIPMITKDEYEILQKYFVFLNVKPMNSGNSVFGLDVMVKQARFVVNLKQ